MAKNIIEKIWDNHIVLEQEGHPAIFAIDLHLMHEVTTPQAFDLLRKKGLQVHAPHRAVATSDHSVSTGPDRETGGTQKARDQVDALRKNTKEFGIRMFDFNSNYQGITHVMAPELGVVQPGMTVACGDSHTATHGAFGAIAFGVGTTEVGHIMAAGCLLQRPMKTMQIIFKGKPQKLVTAKDYILKLIQTIGANGGAGYILEYAGEAIEALDMEQRMTICNMSIEAGARAGLIAPDQTTYEYLKKTPAFTHDDFAEAVEYWESLKSDPDAEFDRVVEIDVSNLEPLVTWGINPEQVIGISESIPDLESLDDSKKLMAQKALDYTGLEAKQPIAGVTVDYVFIGSCTNGRLSDLRMCAEVFKNRQVADNTEVYIVPGSEGVKIAAEEEGLDQIFLNAGAKWRFPGCSMCLAMNDDVVPPGKRCISTSNRNFVGRQGTGSITHLVNPYLAAAAAVTGKITDARELI
jgi:3-isopropylmalate/(R)-2-methylmalate dehydratase large subunit